MSGTELSSAESAVPKRTRPWKHVQIRGRKRKTSQMPSQTVSIKYVSSKSNNGIVFKNRGNGFWRRGGRIRGRGEFRRKKCIMSQIPSLNESMYYEVSSKSDKLINAGSLIQIGQWESVEKKGRGLGGRGEGISKKMQTSQIPSQNEST